MTNSRIEWVCPKSVPVTAREIISPSFNYYGSPNTILRGYKNSQVINYFSIRQHGAGGHRIAAILVS